MVWLSILGEEVGEANQAANEAYLFLDGYPSEADWSKYREELIQIGAVVIAMIESYDRKRGVYLEAFAERTQLEP